ncbi:hypothetical protein B0J18DRAFT_361322 [Chaetomium sp. MPI-SDFR-AT-0129]|nr:hypothetical protein B0J18DRAFT_361322 [Chaetomium sp. MPI-SDFR-AT-0129]
MRLLFAALVAFLTFVVGSPTTISALLGAPPAASSAFSVVLAAAFSLVAAMATPNLARGLGRSRFSLRALASLAMPALLLSAVLFVGPASAAPWSTDLCVRPTSVGASSEGAPFTLLAEAGSSVRTLRLFRNNGRDGYLRGLVVVFSDGTEMRAGVRKDQFAELTLEDDEVITGMTLWFFTPRHRWTKSAKSGPRVGRIDVSTNQRSWGYGVDSTAKLSSKAVNVGSGLLVGFQGRAGDDLDQVAPVFLRTLESSVVDDIVFDKPAGSEGLRLVTLREGTAAFAGTPYSWQFSGSESRDASTAFASSTTNALTIGTTFKGAALPAIIDGGIEASWTFTAGTTITRTLDRSATLSWSTSIDISESNPAVTCSAMVWEGHLRLRWTGTQTVVAGGAVSSFPATGILNHVAYGKVETSCRPAAVASSSRRVRRAFAA